MKVIFVGEKYHPASPSVTLAKALKNCGFETGFSEGIELTSTAAWLKKVREYDAMIVVSYNGPELFRTRQIALASAVGVVVFRWWIGSDVLYCLDEPDTRRNAQTMDKICALNIAVATHLQEELNSINIEADFIPSIVVSEESQNNEINNATASKILVYMPSNRKEFYGFEIVKGLIERYPERTFTIVADTEHSLAQYQNVESLGWVDDMHTIWPEVLCVLRITKHDGMPRMVLEALKKQKYAVYSWPLAGCHYANDLSSATKSLGDVFASPVINSQGPEAYDEIMLPPPEERFAQHIKQVLQKPGLKRRVTSVLLSLSLSYKLWRNPNLTS